MDGVFHELLGSWVIDIFFEIEVLFIEYFEIKLKNAKNNNKKIRYFLQAQLLRDSNPLPTIFVNKPMTQFIHLLDNNQLKNRNINQNKS
jgi:hypothetical protein